MRISDWSSDVCSSDLQRIDRLVSAIAEGAGAFTEIRASLATATAEREALQADLDDLVSLPVVALHPQIAEQYRSLVRDLAASMNFPEAQKMAKTELRALIDSLVITPDTAEKGVDIHRSDKHRIGEAGFITVGTRGLPTYE